MDLAAKGPNLNKSFSVKKQYKSSNGQGARKKTKKTYNIVNLAFFNNKNIAFDSNLKSIDDNTSINFAEERGEDINDFIPAPQKTMFHRIL